jgi:hypothetical protein
MTVSVRKLNGCAYRYYALAKEAIQGLCPEVNTGEPLN